MVRIGIVGSGFMAETHVAAYERVPDADVVAVASPNNAESFVDDHGLDADAVTSAADLFRADIDAVDVCSPTPTHREYVERALEAGLDVLCEKPLAASLADAEAMAERAANSDAMLTVGHVLRFFPEYVSMKESVDAGDIGEPGVARARRLSPFPDWGSENWYADRSKTGGVLLDLAIHDLDYLRWTVGEVAHVFARSTGDEREHAHVTLRFENGAVGYVEATWGLPESGDLRSQLELAGDEGLIEYDSADPAALVVTDDEGTRTTNPTEKGGYAHELAAFVDTVAEGSEPPVSATDAVAAIRLSMAAKESIERDAPVAPEEVEA